MTTQVVGFVSNNGIGFVYGLSNIKVKVDW